MAHEWTFTWLLSAHAYGEGGRIMVCDDSQLSKLSDNRNRMEKEGGRGREDKATAHSTHHISHSHGTQHTATAHSTQHTEHSTRHHITQSRHTAHITQPQHTAHSTQPRHKGRTLLTLLQDSQDPKQCLGHSNCSPSQESVQWEMGGFTVVAKRKARLQKQEKGQTGLADRLCESRNTESKESRI